MDQCYNVVVKFEAVAGWVDIHPEFSGWDDIYPEFSGWYGIYPEFSGWDLIYLEILLERLLDFLSLSDLVSHMSWNWKRRNETKLSFQKRKTRRPGSRSELRGKEKRWTWISGGGSSPVFNLLTTIDSSLTQSIRSTALSISILTPEQSTFWWGGIVLLKSVARSSIFVRSLLPDHLLLTLAQYDEHLLLCHHVAGQPLAHQTQPLPEKSHQCQCRRPRKSSNTSLLIKKCRHVSLSLFWQMVSDVIMGEQMFTLLQFEAGQEVPASPSCCARGQRCLSCSTDSGTWNWLNCWMFTS